MEMRRSMAAVNSRATVDNKRMDRKLDNEIRFQLTPLTNIHSHFLTCTHQRCLSTLITYTHVMSSHQYQVSTIKYIFVKKKIIYSIVLQVIKVLSWSIYQQWKRLDFNVTN